MSDFPADSVLVADVIASPNHGERAGNRSPDMIVLHYTGMVEGLLALERLCARESAVSSHYFIHEDGRIIQCVAEARRAWHAGESFWDGETDINSCAIGIEMQNPGHEFGYHDFPRRQIAAAIALCRGIVMRRDISPDRVLAHSDVAPERKQDPGEKFPWHLLAQSGVGHWVKPAEIIAGSSFEMGDRGDAIAGIQAALSEYGYRIPTDGFFDEVTRAVVTAFQRHFRPARVDGVVDSSTLITLRALLETRPPRDPAFVRAAPARDEEVRRDASGPDDMAQDEPGLDGVARNPSS